jgi:hypothetical protein
MSIQTTFFAGAAALLIASTLTVSAPAQSGDADAFIGGVSVSGHRPYSGGQLT